MSLFFLTPEQQAAKDAEEAREAAELKVLQEAAQGNITYGPVDTRVNVEAYQTPEQLAAIAAEEERKKEEQRLEAIRVSEQMSDAYDARQQAELDLKDLERDDFLESGDYEQRKEDFLKGEDTPSQNPQFKNENVRYRDALLDFELGSEYSDLSQYEQIQTGLNSDYQSPSNFSVAKQKADNYYIESLTRSLEKATTDEEKENIQKLIDAGAPDFNTLEDIKNYESLKDAKFKEDFDVGREEYSALKIQEAVMGDFITSSAENYNFAADQSSYYFKESDGIEFESFEDGNVLFNTGTAFNQISSSKFEEGKGAIGQVGGYSYIMPEVKEMSTFTKYMGNTLDVFTVLYPSAAPLLQGMKTLAQTEGDIVAALKSAGASWATNAVLDKLSGDGDGGVEGIIPEQKVPQPDTGGFILVEPQDLPPVENQGDAFWWLPDINLPDFDLPDINLPDFDLPDINLPDFNLPDLTLPDFDLPDLTLPDLTLPDVNLPDLTLPDLTLPDINLPDLNLPDLPDINLPKLDLELPEVDLELPKLDLELPEVDLELPKLDLELPEVDLELPELDVELPELDVELPELDVELPELDLDLPSVDLDYKAAEQEEEETEVEQIFNEELFKYDTQIKYTQGLLTPSINLRKFG